MESLSSAYEPRSLTTLQRRFRLKALPKNNESKLYEKYFNKGIARQASFAQMSFAFLILGLQMLNMGLYIGPPGQYDIETKTAGILPSILTLFAGVMTLWAVQKPSYFKLHSSMALHIVACIVYVELAWFLVQSVIPSLQTQIYKGKFRTTSDGKIEYLVGNVDETQLVTSLAFSVAMALGAILQANMALFMSLKTGRAICCGRTQLESRCLQVETLPRAAAIPQQSPSTGSRIVQNLEEERTPAAEEETLERSDALPPPPYESGYFKQP